MPADCRLLEARALQVDESSLTGESFPVDKTTAPVPAHAIADRRSMLYDGTAVAAGRATAVVVATGSTTETGRSMAAASGAAPVTGVEARLAQITRTTLPLAVGSAGAVVAAGLLRGRPAADSIGAAVGLAVASVPEGLPFLVSAAQLASARRLAARGALVRNPRTIEALGRVDVLCFDKTGTLTQGRMAVAAVSDGTVSDGTVSDRTVSDRTVSDRTGSRRPGGGPGGPSRPVLAAALRATPQPRAGRRAEHMTDAAVVTAAAAGQVTRSDGHPGWRRVAALPFEPSRSYHATLGITRKGTLLSVKGAPEVILPRCASWRGCSLHPAARTQLNAQLDRLTSKGYRVLAVAENPVTARRQLADDEITDLAFAGFVAFGDPVRTTAGASVRELREAGVHVVMITGDHPATAAAIAAELDVLNGGTIVTGTELDRLDDDALGAALADASVIARSTPAHKVRVVQAFQRLGRTVAMTGDGANDAAAIALADVGIALGRRGTPAARAAADLVVSDDRLETIIAAVVEGRAMWASVRQAIGILVGGNIGEIGYVLLGSLLTGRSPLSARQLLLVNLLTDLAPALAVALRPPDPGSASTLLAEGPEASLGSALTEEVAVRAVATTAGATAAWLGARATGSRPGPAPSGWRLWSARSSGRHCWSAGAARPWPSPAWPAPGCSSASCRRRESASSSAARPSARSAGPSRWAVRRGPRSARCCCLRWGAWPSRRSARSAAQRKPAGSASYWPACTRRLRLLRPRSPGHRGNRGSPPRQRGPPRGDRAGPADPPGRGQLRDVRRRPAHLPDRNDAAARPAAACCRRGEQLAP